MLIGDSSAMGGARGGCRGEGIEAGLASLSSRVIVAVVRMLRVSTTRSGALHCSSTLGRRKDGARGEEVTEDAREEAREHPRGDAMAERSSSHSASACNTRISRGLTGTVTHSIASSADAWMRFMSNSRRVVAGEPSRSNA